VCASFRLIDYINRGIAEQDKNALRLRLTEPLKEINIWLIIEEAASEAEEAEVSADQERCTRQPVLTAVRKLKYLSSHPVTDRYIAENATRNINQRDTNFKF